MAATCSSCSALPCQCSPSTDPVAGCDDPGLIREGEHASTFDEEFCPKRIIPFMGLDSEGDYITDGDIIRAYRVQTAEGRDTYASPPCIPFPIFTLTTDPQGYGLNGVDKLLARSSTCEIDLVGPDDANGFMMWDHTTNIWTLSPGIPYALPCVTTTSPTIIVPTVDGPYQFQLIGDTSSFSVDGSFNVDIEKDDGLGTFLTRGTFKITQIINYGSGLTLLLAERTSDDIAETGVVNSGLCISFIGFLPIDFCGLPSLEEDDDDKFIFDSLAVCKDGELFKIDPVDGAVLVGVDGKWEQRIGYGEPVYFADVEVGHKRDEVDHPWSYGGLNMRSPFPAGSGGTLTGDHLVTSSGVPTGAKEVLCWGQAAVDSTAGGAGRATVRVNGFVLAECWTNTGGTFGYQAGSAQWMKVTDDKIAVSLETEPTSVDAGVLLTIRGYRM